MRMNLTILIFIFGWFASSYAYLASFSGDSFLFQSLDSSPQDTTSVFIRFQTSSTDGLLFLALGHKQYLLIELTNGRIEVKINLGYGEEILSTDEDQSLNNLIWHEFRVIRSGSNIKLVLNGKDVASDQVLVPNSSAAKFAINFGIFVGGLGGNLTLPKGIQPSKFYRGCLLTAEVNGHDLLTPLLPVPNRKILYNVLPGCPKIFRAGRSEPMTFDSPSSYAATRRWTTQDEGTFECMLKTTGRTGIILYNSGRGRGEFIGLEMVDGVIGASVNKGGGVVALHTTTAVNDGNWHAISFSFSPSYLDIRVDGNRTKAFVEQTDSKLNGGMIGVRHHNLDLAGHLYIGGVPGHMLEKDVMPRTLISLAQRKGSDNAGAAFPGCMKNLRINHRRKGFSDFLISNKISAGCKKNPEFSHKPQYFEVGFKETNSAVTKLFHSFQEKHRNKIPSTTTAVATTESTTLSPVFKIPVLTVVSQPLVVTEGKHADLSNKELKFKEMTSDHSFSNSEIVLVLNVHPSHGHLAEGGNCNSDLELASFTLQDIGLKVITYCHDGSETDNDAFEFTMFWNLVNKDQETQAKIISQFRGKTQLKRGRVPLNNGSIYTQAITITPVDDPPELHIPVNYVFHPIKRTATHLPADILQATDPDSLPRQVLYSIMGSAGSSSYRIENENSPDQAMVSFTQEDLDEGRLLFVHEGGLVNTRLILKISNLKVTGSTAVLRIAAIEMMITVSTKEIKLLEKSSFILTTQHLNSTTNADDGTVELKYEVIEKPSLGAIQVMESDLTEDGRSTWVEASNFTQSQLIEGKVRYENLKTTVTTDEADFDRFIFTVSGIGVVSSPQTLPIKVQKVDVNLTLSTISLVNGTQEWKLTEDLMDIDITHVETTSDQIHLQIEKGFEYLTLFYNDNNSLIEEGYHFTLEDAQRGRVSVRVKQVYAAETIHEEASFVAVVNGIYYSQPVKLNVTYVPDLTRIQLLNLGLELSEGDEKLIDPETLWASLPLSPVTAEFQRFHYAVTNGPSHGKLKLMRSRGQIQHKDVKLFATSDDDNSEQNTLEFTSMDIDQNGLYYRHDDSETTADSFSFRVTPILERKLPKNLTNLSTVYHDAIFNIIVNLVNDETPVRVVEQDFLIVRHGRKLITKDDLWYHDNDIDFDDLDLVYTRRRMDNGEIVNATSKRKEKLFSFTQRDIENEQVLFQHKGADRGRFSFNVKDEGRRYLTGHFMVSASEAFVRIVNASQLLAVKGEETVITASNLWSSTNVKGLKREIIYKITKPPEHGVLLLNGKELCNVKSTLGNFTQQDIYNGKLVYKHDTSASKEDVFEFEVFAGEQMATSKLPIKVILKSYLEPPSVQKNRTIVIEDGERVRIMKKDLRIIHPDTNPADIIMTISQAPRMGFLQISRNSPDSEFGPDETVAEFSQSDINHGKLWYIHNDSFPYTAEDFIDGILLDGFVFNVTNGILTVRNLRLNIDIIPKRIPLRVSNFTLLEGETKEITGEYLHVVSPHFEDTNIEVRVVVPPSHGTLESSENTGVALENFNLNLVTSGLLRYVHDGSDTMEDMYSLQTFTKNRSKKSDVKISYITIIPDNDEIPIVVNNTGMTVWTNSVTELTSSFLGTTDADNGPEEISYGIQPPSNGWVANHADPSTPILDFTQERVNKGEIVFVHKGDSTGGFTFEVNDGLNYDNKRIFVITAKPLLITVEKNIGIQVFPGTTTQITNISLLSITNDEKDRIITYAIAAQPMLGRIVKMSITNDHGDANITAVFEEKFLEEEVTTFTQQDIDEGILYFIQDQELTQWSEMDNVLLTVQSPPADNIIGLKFTLNITYDAYGSVGRTSPFDVKEDITLDEGGKFIITTDTLNARNLYKIIPPRKNKLLYMLIYKVVDLPNHGSISITGTNVTKQNTTFRQNQLEENEISYLHDHSDSTQDSFGLEMYIIDTKHSSGNGGPWLVPGSTYHDRMNVTIRPVNDNPPVLMTKGKSLEVVDGFDTPILPAVLSAIDLDTPPEGITYTIVRQPVLGRLINIIDRDTIVTRFTQADINAGSILFSSFPNNATDTTLKDTLYFGFSDGTQRTSYSLFQIKIVPLYLHFNPLKIEITQGYFSHSIRENLLNVSTNGNLSHILFRVTQPPESGVVLVREEETPIFSYEDVSNNEVNFAMIRSDMSHDVLKVMAVYNYTTVSGITADAPIEIVVIGQLVKGSLEASLSGLTRVNLSVLNATSLQRRTNSMPIYEVLEAPAQIQFVKLYPPQIDQKEPANSGKAITKREIRGYSHLLQEVKKFTHGDIESGYVFLDIPETSITSATSVKLRLTVEDGSVQPADFEFEFQVVAKEAEDYSAFFQQFIPEVPEKPTEAKEDDVTVSSTDTMPTLPSFVNISKEKDLRILDELDNDPTDIAKSVEHSESSTNLWMIPIAVVIALIVIITISIAVTCFVCSNRNKDEKVADSNGYHRGRINNRTDHAGSGMEDDQDNHNLGPASNMVHGNNGNELAEGTLRSPACPGVTVKILNMDRSEVPDSIQPSVYNGDRQSLSMFSSAMGVHSYRDDIHPSTIYTPSTVYNYDDCGSVDLVDGAEADYYIANRASYGSQQRLYHARSAKMIDPDVLALYSSDESIPSMIDEKYATPYRGSAPFTGSVPTGLNRSNSQPARSPAGLGGSQSTASLSRTGISPGLSLLPNSGAVVNQYWI